MKCGMRVESGSMRATNGWCFKNVSDVNVELPILFLGKPQRLSAQVNECGQNLSFSAFCSFEKSPREVK